MAVFVLSCESAFGGKTEGSEKLQDTVNIAGGGSHRRIGCATHPASPQSVTEASKTYRAAIGRVFCAGCITTCRVHTGVKLFTVVWKFGGSKGACREPSSARIIWTALDLKPEKWLADNVKRIFETGGSRGSQQRRAKHARA